MSLVFFYNKPSTPYPYYSVLVDPAA